MRAVHSTWLRTAPRATSRGAGWLLLGLLAAPAPAQAGLCALCRRTLEQSGNAGLIHGFYWSILLIGSIPLLVLLIGGGLILRHLWLPRR